MTAAAAIGPSASALASPVHRSPGRPDGRPVINLRDRYVWIACPVEGLEAVRVEMRLCLINSEVDAYQRAFAELQERLRPLWDESGRLSEVADAAMAETDPAAKEAASEARAEALRLARSAFDETRAFMLEQVAPHVRAWNLGMPGDLDAPAPAEVGAEAFRHGNREIEEWLIGRFRHLLTGYTLKAIPEPEAVPLAIDPEPVEIASGRTRFKPRAAAS